MSTTDKVTLYISKAVGGGTDWVGPIDLVSYTIKYDTFAGASTFTAEVDYTFDLNLLSDEAAFEILINDTTVMIGYIDKIDRSVNRQGTSVTVSGRDMMQVLIDNYVLAPHVYPGKPHALNALQKVLSEDTSSYKYIELDKYIQDVFKSSQSVSSVTTLRPTGGTQTNKIDELSIPPIEIKYTKSAERFKKVKIKELRTNHGDDLYRVISNAINPLGLYLYNQPGTNQVYIYPVVTDVHDPEVASTTQELGFTGNNYIFVHDREDAANCNVLSSHRSFNRENFHTFVRYIGQCQSEDVVGQIIDSDPKYLYSEYMTTTAWERNKSSFYVSSMEGGRVFNKQYNKASKAWQGYPHKIKAKVVNVLDKVMWYDYQEQLLRNEQLHMMRQLYNFEYVVQGHCPQQADSNVVRNTIPYAINRVAIVTDPTQGLYQQKLLVYGVEFSGSRTGGHTTKISMYSTVELTRNQIMFQKIINTLDEVIK